MSLNTYVHIGAYLVCTMKKIPTTTKVFLCSDDENHKVSGLYKFCGECGAKVKFTTIDGEGEYLSFYSILDNDDQHSADDIQWLQDNFRSVLNADAADIENQEVLLLNNSHTVDCMWDVEARSVDFSKVCEVTVDLDRLKQLLQYTNIEINYGVVVEVC